MVVGCCCIIVVGDGQVLISETIVLSKLIMIMIFIVFLSDSVMRCVLLLFLQWVTGMMYSVFGSLDVVVKCVWSSKDGAGAVHISHSELLLLLLLLVITSSRVESCPF